MPPASPVPLRRIAARGRPFEDPACAGCPHLPRLRAVRRGEAEPGGPLGCESRQDACVRGAPRSSPVAVDPVRCNRCGSCLSLGCVALFDPGGESMEIDRALCVGCDLCAPLCRSRAIRRDPGPATARPPG